jgi:hypothetical protein
MIKKLFSLDEQSRLGIDSPKLFTKLFNTNKSKEYVDDYFITSPKSFDKLIQRMKRYVKSHKDSLL